MSFQSWGILDLAFPLVTKNKSMRNRFQRIMFVLALFVMVESSAQQESMMTFFKHHLNLVNPASIGASDEAFLTSTIRRQWVGIADAPETQAVSFGTSLGNNLYLGLGVIHDKTFIEKQTFVGVDFAYKVKLSTQHDLLMGLKVGGNAYDVNASGLETYNITSDPRLGNISRFNPNVGVGFHLLHEDYFVSLSVPRMLNTERARNEDGFATVATDRAHFYLSGGYHLVLDDVYTLKPATIIRYVNGAPFSVDFNTMLSYEGIFDVGVAYRTDKSLAGLASFLINDKFLVGYAYDYSTRSQLLGRANGSHEILLQYKFK